MRFLFDCEDEICLPAAYRLVDKVKDFSEKMKEIDVEKIDNADRSFVFRKIIEKMMLEIPKETGEILSSLWILEEGEKAPNAFKTIAELFRNEVAIDFFASVLPSLLQLSKEVSPLFNKKN